MEIGLYDETPALASRTLCDPKTLTGALCAISRIDNRASRSARSCSPYTGSCRGQLRDHEAPMSGRPTRAR
jgi:hypothetical protein